ncbi:MAG TPA: HAD-IB family phosphatase [Candidatus Saccharimonadia bacterium]|jgi:phosphoserine phosphatase|nr:HAD-IB family phosphatase [Candidatus Saccharimonadia bacterium]
MTIRAMILDFDGTLVTADISDILAGLAGKQAESEELNRLFHGGQLRGLEGLVRRINFLSGLPVAELKQAVAENDFLRPGAHELFAFLKARGIISIIASGSIVPLLEVYQAKLGADYIIGSRPIIKDGRLVSISAAEYSGPDYKVRDSSIILKQLGIPASAVVAIGDSPADRGLFEMAAASIAIDPKAGIERDADFTIRGDLSAAIPILERLMQSGPAAALQTP